MRRRKNNNHSEGFLMRHPSKDFESFLNSYCTVFPEVDPSIARELTRKGFNYYKGKKDDGSSLQERLEERRYETEQVDPDYSCYSNRYYFTDLWVCWVMYSRGYLRAISTRGSFDKDLSVMEVMGHVGSVADLGCGIAYTMRALVEMFPDVAVYGTNLKGTDQWTFCEYMAAEYGFRMVESISMLPSPVDLIVAFEYFEHIKDPINHVHEVVEAVKPKFLCIANSFGTRSIGHFTSYIEPHAFFPYDGKRISRKFNTTLRHLGYERVKTRLWNQKPSLWRQTGD